MMKADKKNHPSAYLNDLEEWQEKQYDPGHWTGGNIPPYLKCPKKPLGILFVMMGLFSALLVLVAILQDFSLENIFSNIVTLLVAIVFLIGGIRIIRSNK